MTQILQMVNLDVGEQLRVGEQNCAQCRYFGLEPSPHHRCPFWYCPTRYFEAKVGHGIFARPNSVSVRP